MKNSINLNEINEIRKDTPIALVGEQITRIFPERQRIKVAYYQKANANWCYFVHVIYYNGELRRVVTMFGEILGA